MSGTVSTVAFACIQNAGRSQMAAAYFRKLADPERVLCISGGTKPSALIHAEVVDAMREDGIDLSGESPQPLVLTLLGHGDLLVTMGCGEECPVAPGVRHLDWELPDPHDKPMAVVRRVRDEIKRRVEELIAAEGWKKRA